MSQQMIAKETIMVNGAQCPDCQRRFLAEEIIDGQLPLHDIQNKPGNLCCASGILAEIEPILLRAEHINNS